MNRRPRNATVNHTSNSQRKTAPSNGRSLQSQGRPDGRSSQSHDARMKALRRRRREAELRRKRRMLFAAIAAAVVIIAVVLLIVISSVTVPAPKQFALESSANTQLLTWKGKPKKISYQIFRKSGESDFELVGQVEAGADSSFVSSDLTPATLYEYQIIAQKGSGEKVRESKAKTISAYTLPETISGATAITMSKDSLTVSWANAQPVNGYELKYSTEQDLSSTEPLVFTPGEVVTNSNTGVLNYTVPNLTVGTTYYFSMRSFCGEDVYSEWSEVFSGTVTQAVDMTGIDINKPMVALTFDDGPDSGAITDRILAALTSAGGHATFFQLGELCERYPDVAKRIVEQGSQIACHTYDHTHMGDAVTTEDIIRANDAIESASGIRPDAFRSPGGASTDLIFSTCTSQGQAIYHWSVDTRDWSSRDADSIVTETQNNVSDGSIILMHNIYDSTADAVERIVPWLVEQGYQLVTVDQLIQAKTGQPPVPGTEYHSAP